MINCLPTFYFDSCEGKCMRSFHATKEAGSDSACESLGFSEEQVKVCVLFVYFWLHFYSACHIQLIYLFL